MRWLVCVVLVFTVALVAESLQVSVGRQTTPMAQPGDSPVLVGVPTQPAGSSATWPSPAVSPAPGPSGTPSLGAQPVTMFIPRLGVRAPVYDRGVDARGQLPIAPGYAITHYHFSTAPGAPGNYVAYGHDDIQGSILRYLSHLRAGDAIELDQGERRYLYRVTGSRVVQPTDLSVLHSTQAATLTLISCTPYMIDTQRVVVTAIRTG